MNDPKFSPILSLTQTMNLYLSRSATPVVLDEIIPNYAVFLNAASFTAIPTDGEEINNGRSGKRTRKGFLIDQWAQSDGKCAKTA